MSSYEFKLWIAEYKSQIKEARAERPLSDSEVKVLGENLGYMPEEYKDAYRRAEGGDFGKFEKLPHLLRNYLGALEMKRLRAKFGDTPSPENPEVLQYLEENALNAALRAGISAEKNVGRTRESAKALDSRMNQILMRRTMMPPRESARETLQGLYGPAHAETELERNRAKQLVMAKAMLLAQVGKYDVIDKNGLSQGLDVPVYETLAHGNRTNFVLPSGEDSQRVLDAFMGGNDSAKAGIEKRTAATHFVKRRSLSKNGIVKSENKEQKTFSPLKVFGHQYGMNIAVGGIGETGPNKEVIFGKGEAGHMYMRAEAGDGKHCGSLMIGIEGSEPGQANYLGNSHDMRAKSAKQSAFLADKSIVGKKTGGRQIDLSGISAEKLAGLLHEFADKYGALQQNANTAEGREKLARVNDMLMGKHMDLEKITDMFASLGMTDPGLKDVVSDARRGYVSRIDAEEISGEAFTQSIRARFSQEKACDIAEARFAYAGDDLKLAAGAIKELMLTHETRSLGWKILHPIKNYRENSMISGLVKKLETEKGFSRAQIATAFSYRDDTFGLDWGNGLSNDREATRFLRDNRDAFLPSDEKLEGLLKNTYKDFGLKDAGAEAEAEVAQMQDELARFLNEANEAVERESIVIAEEDEANKSIHAEVTEEIVPKEPALDRQKEI